MKIYTQDEIVENMKKCPHFESCSQNLCPLDIELELRYGNKNDRCRFMREPRATRIGIREFITGGSVMPDALLNFVPESNLERLNTSSQERWEEINNN